MTPSAQGDTDHSTGTPDTWKGCRASTGSLVLARLLLSSLGLLLCCLLWDVLHLLQQKSLRYRDRHVGTQIDGETTGQWEIREESWGVLMTHTTH